jgi:hypothetical protein
LKRKEDMQFPLVSLQSSTKRRAKWVELPMRYVLRCFAIRWILTMKDEQDQRVRPNKMVDDKKKKKEKSK